MESKALPACRNTAPMPFTNAIFDGDSYSVNLSNYWFASETLFAKTLCEIFSSFADPLFDADVLIKHIIIFSNTQ